MHKGQAITKKMYYLRLVIILLLLIAFTPEFGHAQMQEQDRCASCHSLDINTNVEKSVHKHLGCESCHQGYDQFPHPEPIQNSVDLCGECHGSTLMVYEESVHGQLGFDCSSCHEEAHSILDTNNPEANVHRLQEAATCGNCHFGTVAYRSYRDSFHGIANSFGSIRNAVCSDCHTAHFILNEHDRRSSVHTDNVAQTCAICHGIAARGFAQGREHYVLERTGYSAPMYWTLKFFIWLMIAVVTLLIIHMQLELYRRLKNAQAKQRKRQERGK